MATKIVYRHFHDGNDLNRSVRGSSLYATRARLIDTTTKAVLSEGWAFCNPTDRPSRELGRKYSRERVISQCAAISKQIKDIENFLIDQTLPKVEVVIDSKPSEEIPRGDIRYLI